MKTRANGSIREYKGGDIMGEIIFVLALASWFAIVITFIRFTTPKSKFYEGCKVHSYKYNSSLFVTSEMTVEKNGQLWTLPVINAAICGLKEGMNISFYYNHRGSNSKGLCCRFRKLKKRYILTEAWLTCKTKYKQKGWIVMHESRIISKKWETRRWSLHDTDELYVITVSNGQYTTEITGFNEEEAMARAKYFIESDNEKRNKPQRVSDVGCW